MHNYRLPAEWETQRYIQFTLPVLEDSWYADLPDVENTLIQLISIISHTQGVLVLTLEKSRILNKLNSLETPANLENISFVNIPSNDIWARDHGIISTVNSNNQPVYNNFGFNGWGLKFPANHDNQINTLLQQNNILNSIQDINIILEGGALETNGQRVLLTTEYCLMAANRNSNFTREDYEAVFSKYLGIDKTIWLTHGGLEGDDTDGHIDTLARFVKEDTIVYTSCRDSNNSQYSSLLAMKQELENTGYKLIDLPVPLNNIYDSENNRLPATYCNFLITNKLVIVPVYNDPHDIIAIETLTKLFPEREIITFNSLDLIIGRGSIHCASMNIL